MKKVKVLLSAAAVVAVIAGTFAAKADIGDVLYTQLNGQGNCSVETKKFLITPVGPTIRASLQKNVPCQVITVTPAGN